jgi:hypothetical protein
MGTVYCTTFAAPTVLHSNLTRDVASAAGAAIDFASELTGLAHIRFITVVACSGPTAAFLDAPKCTVVDSLFQNNTIEVAVLHSGVEGGVYEARGCTFAGNHAPPSGGREEFEFIDCHFDVPPVHADLLEADNETDTSFLDSESYEGDWSLPTATDSPAQTYDGSATETETASGEVEPSPTQSPTHTGTPERSPVPARSPTPRATDVDFLHSELFGLPMLTAIILIAGIVVLICLIVVIIVCCFCTKKADVVEDKSYSDHEKGEDLASLFMSTATARNFLAAHEDVLIDAQAPGPFDIPDPQVNPMVGDDDDVVW